MNNEKPYFLKRLAAYLIDFILVTLLASAISLVFLDNTKYQGSTEELFALSKKLNDNEITKEEYLQLSNDLTYQMTKDNVGISIVNVGVALVYYVILCYFYHGITLGKYLLKMKIVSSKDKELNMGNYLIRALFVNLILSYVVSIVFVSVLDKANFIAIYPTVSNLLTIFLFVTLIVMMYRSDGRGLHDMISSTVVISTKEPKNKDIVKEEVVEAKVIEEKPKETEKTKKVTKKSTKKNETKKTGGKKQ